MFGLDSGFVEGVGLDGLERMYAFRSLPVDNSAQTLLMIGLPTTHLYADANRHLATYLGLLLVMLVLTVLMAWIAADLFVLRDVRALLGATERLADGDLSTRVPAPSSSGELTDLALRFNDLARDYNSAIKRVPAVFFAGIFGFTEKPYFAAKPGADTPPAVQFDFNKKP